MAWGDWRVGTDHGERGEWERREGRVGTGHEKREGGGGWVRRRVGEVEGESGEGGDGMLSLIHI